MQTFLIAFNISGTVSRIEFLGTLFDRAHAAHYEFNHIFFENKIDFTRPAILPQSLVDWRLQWGVSPLYLKYEKSGHARLKKK